MILIGAVRMTSIGVCSDTSDAVELLEAQGLYVKPVAKVNISVQLPQLKSPGASISNWEVMEKLKKMIKPDSFLVLKVVFSAHCGKKCVFLSLFHQSTGTYAVLFCYVDNYYRITTAST